MFSLRHAFRRLAKSPGFTAVALMTLAICIGANLTVFSVVDAILVRSLPFPDADRLVTMFNTYPGAGVDRDESSITNYYERRDAIDAFDSLAAFEPGSAIVGESGSTARVETMRVSPEFFDTVGVAPARGRAFTDAETTWQTAGVVVLTDSYWRQHCDADPAVLGRAITIDGQSNTVVGVLPPDFRFLSHRSRLFLPFAFNPEQRESAQRHWGGTRTVARLKPGVTIAQAQAQIDAHNREMEQDHPSPQAAQMTEVGFQSILVSLHNDHVASVRPMLWLLQVAALFLLIIGAANLVNLLLIRANARSGEFAIRQALGAGRRNIVRDVVGETMVLTIVGGLLGFATGAVGMRALALFGTGQLPLAAEIQFDARLAAAALISCVTLGIAIGLPIAWSILRSRFSASLSQGARSTTGSRSTVRLRHGFIVAQIALAFMLLAGAGLLSVSLKKAMAIPPGFNPDRVLTAELALPWNDYRDIDARVAFQNRLIDALEQQPGVLAAGITTNLPLSGVDNKSAAVPAKTSTEDAGPRGHYAYGVAGNHFAALGIPLQEGRLLDADDSQRGERVCVIDADFARYYWPDGNVVGQQVFQGGQPGADDEAFTVVGIVAPVKQADLTENAAVGAIYFPFRFRTDNDFNVVVRTSLPPPTVGATLRSAVQGIDPDLPLENLQTMQVRIADSLMTRRSPALLAGVLSGIALLLAVIGLYGVMAYSVAQRTSEFGLRIALGAQRANVLALVVRQGLRLIVFGLIIGTIGALLLTDAMGALLYDISPQDPLMLTAVATILALVAVCACLIPAHRATRVNPMVALRSD